MPHRPSPSRPLYRRRRRTSGFDNFKSELRHRHLPTPSFARHSGTFLSLSFFLARTHTDGLLIPVGHNATALPPKSLDLQSCASISFLPDRKVVSRSDNIKGCRYYE